MEDKFSQLVNLAIRAALQAGELLYKGFGTFCEAQSKSNQHDLVTQYDTASETSIYDTLMNQFPSHGFWGEEKGYIKKSDTVWIVDPLDGTLNFFHSIPIFCVSIAALVEESLVACSIYQPMTEELFWATKGGGAFCNGRKLHVSLVNSLDAAFIATGFPYDDLSRGLARSIETCSQMLQKGIFIRRLGAAALDLAYVAKGAFDGYFEKVVEPWDCAAGRLLVEEAGGKVSCYDGSMLNPFASSSILATNGWLHSDIKAFL